MIINGVAYHPKGSMCASCTKRDEDCSALPFSEMQVLEVNKIDPFLDGGMLFKTVKCTSFERISK